MTAPVFEDRFYDDPKAFAVFEKAQCRAECLPLVTKYANTRLARIDDVEARAEGTRQGIALIPWRVQDFDDSRRTIDKVNCFFGTHHARHAKIARMQIECAPMGESRGYEQFVEALATLDRCAAEVTAIAAEPVAWIDLIRTTEERRIALHFCNLELSRTYGAAHKMVQRDHREISALAPQPRDRNEHPRPLLHDYLQPVDSWREANDRLESMPTGKEVRRRQQFFEHEILQHRAFATYWATRR